MDKDFASKIEKNILTCKQYIHDNEDLLWLDS